jgi:hypothetical protein
MKKAVSILLFMLICFSSFAQNQTQKVNMADAMRSNGKIYVVVAVILTIFAGLIIYLARLDRKISRLEKQS